MREQLTLLRRAMAEHKVDWYLVPTDDFHSSEYVGDHFKCREWMSGFTGSAGTLLVSQTWAGLWTDGRYFLQAGEQLAGTGIELMKQREPGVPTVPEYLKEHVEGGLLGFDGRTVNVRLYRELKEAAGRVDGNMDLVGEIWTDRPALSAAPVFELPLSACGQSRASKLADVRRALWDNGADALVLSSLMDICWLMNIRGGDVDCTPVVLSFCAVTENSCVLFINGTTLSAGIREALEKDGVEIAPYDGVYAWIAKLPSGKVLQMNLNVANSALLSAVPEGVSVKDCKDPTNLPKAVKNATEVRNFRTAHVKDGVAVTRLMYWLKQNAGRLPMDEMSIAQKLISFRREQEGYISESFTPIIAYGPHGAIVHYHPTEETNIPVQARSFLLADTGAHYMEGSTDITRTFALGPITAEEKKCYTLVLKGNLALGAAVFKNGCTGFNLDILARMPLWQAGLDYNHGTGHGVGYILSVHEGPHSIHWSPRSTQPILPGMVVSNEPGYYAEGKFGVRLENLIVCVEGEETDYGRFFRFDHLTMVPWDLEAVDVSLLTSQEKQWLNDYHRLVRETIGPRLPAEEAEWLAQATREV